MLCLCCAVEINLCFVSENIFLNMLYHFTFVYVLTFLLVIFNYFAVSLQIIFMCCQNLSLVNQA